MNFIDQWQARKLEIETALAAGIIIDPAEAEKELKHLKYRLARRPRILQRRRDRKQYEAQQQEKRRAAKEAREASEVLK